VSVIINGTTASGTAKTATQTVSSCALTATVSPNPALISQLVTPQVSGFTPGDTVKVTVYLTSTSFTTGVYSATVGANGALQGNLTTISGLAANGATFPAPGTAGVYSVGFASTFSSTQALTPTLTVNNPPSQAGTGNLVLVPAGGNACTPVTTTASSAAVSQTISAVATGFTSGETVNFIIGGTVVTSTVANSAGVASVIFNPSINNLGGITPAGGLAGVSQSVTALGLTSGFVGSATLQGCPTLLTASSPSGSSGVTVQTIHGEGFPPTKWYPSPTTCPRLSRR